MSGLNKVFLIGYLGQDPSLRYLPNGTAVASFSIATSETWKDGSGEKQEHTEWTNITAFGKLAETCGEYLHKGSQVYVSGKLRTETWKDKDGNQQKATKIIISEMIMLGGGSGKKEEKYPVPKERQKEEDSDIPF